MYSLQYLLCVALLIIIMQMSDQECYFESQAQATRLIKIEQANPIITKTFTQEPKKVSLKMVPVDKKPQPTLYQYLRTKKSPKQEEAENELNEIVSCPFTQFYSKQQLVYQRFINDKFNIVDDVLYFSGAFIPKNVLSDYIKEDCSTLNHIVSDYFDEGAPTTFRCSQDPIFNSNFESGNLFAVFKVNNHQYDLVMQKDTNSKGNNQWFYFSVQGIKPSIDYTFNVVNFTKTDSLFNYGMSPTVFSTTLHKKKGVEWLRMGKEITYKKGKIPRENKKKYYYMLSFKINWKYANDKLYIAHSYPYTFTKLQSFLKHLIHDNQDITRVTIGKTISKKPIQCLIISQEINKKRDNRKAIIFMARQHPGETQGSFVCEGVLEKLVQKSKESDFLRRNYVIYVIPMVNVDGVIFGHYRSNLGGKDLNRKWDSNDKQSICPEVSAIKHFIAQISKERQIRFILDLHGHSKKMGSFFYGNPCLENPQHVRIFPYVCSKFNQAIQYGDCTFATEQYKRKAARVYLSHLYRQLHVYTFQSSFYGFYRDNRKQQFTPKEYANLGATLINVLYLQLENEIKSKQKSMNTDEVNIFQKYLTELKSNKQLMEVGNQQQSGSDSQPLQGQINIVKVPQIEIAPKKNKQFPQIQYQTIKIEKPQHLHHRKISRELKEPKQVLKSPTKNHKYLQMNRVNSVLPNKYELGLEPSHKKQYSQVLLQKSQTVLRRVSTQCQTDRHTILSQFRNQEIQSTQNLSNSVKIDLRSIKEKRYSSLVKNSNGIYRIELTNTSNPKVPPFMNAYSQTLLSFQKQNKSVLPKLYTPQSQKWSTKSNLVKGNKTPDLQLFSVGIVNRYLLEKEMMKRDVIDRPLTIKKKELYKK